MRTKHPVGLLGGVAPAALIGFLLLTLGNAAMASDTATPATGIERVRLHVAGIV